MTPENCPHCGMSWSGMSAQYHCGTYPIASLKGKTAQSIACKEIARLRAESASPSCDRCQSAHCCSVTGSSVPPLCVTDPDSSIPGWMPWTNADVREKVSPLHAEIGRLRAEAGRVVVPELEGIPVVQPEFDDSGNKTHWNVFDSDTDRLLWTEDPEEEWRKHRRIAAHSVPSSRVLKDGEVAVGEAELAALREFADGWSEFRSQFDDIQYHHSGMGCGIEDRGIHDRYAACEHGWECAMERVAERFPEIDTLDTLRTQATESGKKGGA